MRVDCNRLMRVKWDIAQQIDKALKRDWAADLFKIEDCERLVCGSRLTRNWLQINIIRDLRKIIEKLIKEIDKVWGIGKRLTKEIDETLVWDWWDIVNRLVKY